MVAEAWYSHSKAWHLSRDVISFSICKDSHVWKESEDKRLKKSLKTLTREHNGIWPEFKTIPTAILFSKYNVLVENCSNSMLLDLEVWTTIFYLTPTKWTPLQQLCFFFLSVTCPQNTSLFLSWIDRQFNQPTTLIWLMSAPTPPPTTCANSVPAVKQIFPHLYQFTSKSFNSFQVSITRNEKIAL